MVQKKEKTTPPRLLVIDDDPLVVEILELFLKRENFEVITTTSGLQALNYIQNIPFSLLLCDEKMEEISGINFFKSARKIQPNATRLLLTGASDEKTIIDAINVGHIDYYVKKPWNEKELLDCINKGIRRFKEKEKHQQHERNVINQNHHLTKHHESLCHEIHVGARIQEKLLSGSIPILPSLEICALSLPSQSVDGDFFEFYQPRPDVLDVVLGDVMGKGIASGLVGTAVKMHLRHFAEPCKHAKVFDSVHSWHFPLLFPEEILLGVESEIGSKLIDLDYFVALFYGRFDLSLHTFSFLDCGTPRPLYWSVKERKIQELSNSHLPLGIREKNSFTPTTLSLNEGDLFFFYSDGISESCSSDGHFFGTKKLVEIINEHHEESAEAVLRTLYEAMVDFSQKRHSEDDRTLIVIKIKRLSPSQNFVISFPSDLAYLTALKEYILQLGSERQNVTNSLELAAHEAFCNIVHHAYKGTHGEIVLRGEVEKEGIRLTLSDRGVSFDPSQLKDPQEMKSYQGGFGWKLIQESVDQVVYLPKSSSSEWNHLTLYKSF